MSDPMKLSITHMTTYIYDEPVRYALQQLRLVPRTGHGQKVLSWQSSITGGSKQVSFNDQFMNHVELVMVDPGATRIEIMSQGVVEIEDRAGVVGKHHGNAPVWLYKEPTALTQPGNHIRHLAAQLRAETEGLDQIARLHQLSTRVSEAVAYEIGKTDAKTTAEMALTAGHGVCQDHAHVMAAVARQLGYPARYVSGYLMMDDQQMQDASHAWCEIWTEELGWIGFDASNNICPDGRYVRVATGRDYRDVAPIRGIRQGNGDEEMHVSLQVQQ